MNSKKILIICNPISGHSDKSWLQSLAAELGQAGHSVQRYDTQCSADASRFLQQEPWQADLLLVAGGDGTINEVITGLNDEQLKTVKILVLATGTANVMARELGINGLANNRSIKRLCELVSHSDQPSKLHRVHLPKLNGASMLLMAGIGFDAWVVKTVSPSLKQRIGKFAYVAAMLGQLSKSAARRYCVSLDGQDHPCNAAIVSNGKLYAGSYRLCPQGDLSKQELQVTLFNGGGFKLLLALLAMPLGLMGKCPGVRQLTAQHITLSEQNSDEPAAQQHAPEPLQIDGDDSSHLPASIDCQDRFATFIGA